MITTAATLRTKKLGILLRDARLASGKNLGDTAQVIGVSPAELEAYELGEKAPSLPEIELLAYYLKVPLSHFWGNTAISESGAAKINVQPQKLLEIRNKVIGALLRQAREGAGLSLEDASELAELSPQQLEMYELGHDSIPLPLLETLGNALNRPIYEFQDKHGSAGIRASQERVIDDFLDLSPELQAFVSKPINRPYLELAQRLSEMSVDKLRSVGEGILEITL
jgi:transcriptional regulator with XRE-family HTH domain